VQPHTHRHTVYRQLYTRDLFLHAYGPRSRNDGTLTPSCLSSKLAVL
jgi:hypothetical protein